MANESTVTMSGQIYNVYEHRLLTRALPRLLHGRWGRVAQWKGFNTYYVRRWEKLNAVVASLTEGKTPSEHVAPTITTITMTPSWYGAWVGYTDKLKAVSFDPVILETSGILGEQAGLSVDTLIRDNLVANATIDYAGGASSRATLDADNDSISFSDWIYVVATLENSNAKPMEGELYPVLISPYTWASLMQDSMFASLFTREGGQSIRSGEIGTVLNCRVYMSSNVKEWVDAGENSTEDIYSALFIGWESYALAGMTGLTPNWTADGGAPHIRGGLTGAPVKTTEIIVNGLGETGFDPLKQRGTIGWKLTHTQQVLNASNIISLEHCNVAS